VNCNKSLAVLPKRLPPCAQELRVELYQRRFYSDGISASQGSPIVIVNCLVCSLYERPPVHQSGPADTNEIRLL
jgi:hypothetical protein